MFLKVIGLLGGFCFAYCGVPAAWASWRSGRAAAPVAVALMIVAGGILMYTYLTVSYGFDVVLAINYSVEIGSWALVARYHFWPRER